MDNLQQIRTKANSFRKNRNYEEAIALYEVLWAKPTANNMDGWGLAYSYSKLKKYEKSLEISRLLYKKDANFVLGKSVYAWSVYYLEIKNSTKQDEARFYKAVKAILSLSTQADKFSPYTVSVFAVLKYLHSKENMDAMVISKWLSCIDMSLLDTDPFRIPEIDGKVRILASNKEKFCIWKAKNLFQLKQYQDCILFCRKVFKEVLQFQNSNDVWLSRLEAKSNVLLGNSERAIKIYESILLRKKDWFIYKELATIQFQAGKTDKALELASLGMLAFGTIDKKIHLLELISTILEKLEKQQLAKKHLELVLKIRLDNQWAIKSSYSEKITAWEIHLEQLPPIFKYIKELKSYWEKYSIEDSTEYEGQIQSILPNQKAGFIRSKGRTYYFITKDFKGNRSDLEKGTRVVFLLKDSFDKKKNKKSKQAIYIKKK